MQSALVLALAAVAAAAPAPQSPSDPGKPLRFTGIVKSDYNQINGTALVANIHNIAIGTNTTTLTPEIGQPSDYNTKDTVFAFTNAPAGQGQLLLSTKVPGGQRAYVVGGDVANGYWPGGLKFDKPHGGAQEPNPVYAGFDHSADGVFKFEGKDWFACPVDSKGQIFSVYAESRIDPSFANCQKFEFKVDQVGDDVKDAWAYGRDPCDGCNNK